MLAILVKLINYSINLSYQNYVILIDVIKIKRGSFMQTGRTQESKECLCSQNQIFDADFKRQPPQWLKGNIRSPQEVDLV